ncbi:MAG: hypothetical protein PVF74_02180 [Anaerolineales bacterium]
MAKVALHPIEVGTGHSRGVGRIGATLQPALGKVAALANVDGIGRANRPNRILGCNRQT